MGTEQLNIVDKKLKHLSAGNGDGSRMWMRLLSCSRMIEEEVKKIFREEFNMTLPRYEVMASLCRVPEGVSMVELSRWLMVTKGNITGIAERLSEDGYITRKPMPTDRRAFCVTLTPQGKALHHRMYKRYEGYINSVFTDITQEETDTFTGLLTKTKENIEMIKEEAVGRSDK